MCGDKVSDYLAELDIKKQAKRRELGEAFQRQGLQKNTGPQQYQLLNGVFSGILDGMRDAYADL
jgi:hypothetical protein